MRWHGTEMLGVLLCAAACAAPRDRAPDSAAVAQPQATPRPVPVAPTAGAASMVHAESLYARGEYDSARAVWELLLPELRLAHDSSREAKALTWLGLTAWRRGDYALARSLGEQALALKLRLGAGADLFPSYNGLGLLAWNEGRLEDASTFFQKAHQIARASADAAALAKVANNSALVFAERGRFAEAGAGFEEARVTAHRLGDARIEGGALTNLGMLHVQLGDPQSAILSLDSARALYRSINYRTGEQNTLAHLATAYEALGEMRLAFAMLDTAIAISHSQGLRQEEAANLELLAEFHRLAGDRSRALRLYEQARAIDKDLGLAVEQGTNLRSAAEILATLGRRDLAASYTAQATRLHNTAGASLQELRDHLMLADLASVAAAPTEASRHLDVAERIAQKLDARTARVEVALAEATIAERAHDARKVLRILSRARADLRRGGYGTEWQESSLRARAFVRLALLDSAAIAGSDAVAAVERTRGRFGSSFLRTAYAADKETAYTDLVDVLLKLGRIEEAFETADAGRSRSLLENVYATAADSSRSPPTIRTFVAAEGQLRYIDTLVARIDGLEETPPAERDSSVRRTLRDLVDTLAETRTAYEDLLIRVAERDAAGASLLGGRAMSAAEVQRALDRGEVLLEYLVTPSRLLIFALTRDRIQQLAVEVPSGDVARQARLARELVGRPGPTRPGDEDVLRELHSSLIEPVERAGLLRGARRLILVPHSALAYVPFAALRRDSASRYLMQDHALLYLPSAAAFAVLRHRRNDPGPSPLTATVFAPFPKSLPASGRELETFRRAQRGSETRSGAEATERELRKALTTRGTVHIATHGTLNPRNPMFSRVELASGSGASTDDGRLEVHEVLGLRIASHLVYLSGCETGLGASWSALQPRGEEFASLSQAFLYAGAHAVVSTLWRVEDAGAAEFAAHFYAYLATTNAPEALAAAQRDMLRSQGLARPFYWAAYQVSGGGSSE